MKFFLHAKIHRATVTEADLDYIGSITVDEDLMDAVGLEEFEKVLVTSVTAGGRLETYIIKGKRGSGQICMNGSAAHIIKKGEIIIIMGFQLSDKPLVPKMILPGEGNRSFEYMVI